MSNPVPEEKKLKLSFRYPHAAAPDIIRSHQKDTFFKGLIFDDLSSLLRRLTSAHFIHAYNSQVRVFSEILYNLLTTFIGNQTLGEEYCNIVQIEKNTQRLPSFRRRTGYILTSTLLPYFLSKLLPRFRSKLRAKLESKIRRLNQSNESNIRMRKIIGYLLENLSEITSSSSIHIITLILFYFSGAYYELSKRIWGLRYVFTRRIPPSEARVGYEVLGVLLLLQISIKIWLQVHVSMGLFSSTPESENHQESLDLPSTTNEDPSQHSQTNQVSCTAISKITNTEILTTPRYDLHSPSTMPWLTGSNRKCTLCLEDLKDPSVPSCGHIFCWECISDWIKEKSECPLCRREILMQHVLPLRV